MISKNSTKSARFSSRSLPVLFNSNRAPLRMAVLACGIPFLCYYVFAYWRLQQRGYVVSPQKIGLLVSTGLVSIFTWGFNTFGEAFFIMNFFHAWQYFALVWWSEKKNLTRVGARRAKTLGKTADLRDLSLDRLRLRHLGGNQRPR